MQVQRIRIASHEETQHKVKFIDNHNANLIDELRNMFASASEAYIAVAFVRASGVALLSEPIRQAISRGASISLLFGLDFALSEPEAIRSLVALGVAARCYSSRDTFHPKGYIFRIGGSISAVVGSSNLSGSGLTSGREWNIAIQSSEPVMVEFTRLWNSEHASPVTEQIYARLNAGRSALELEHLIGKEDRSMADEVSDEAPRAEISVGPAIRFDFKMNQSFKTYGQLTVPKVCYSRLECEGFRDGNLTVAFEDQRELRGFMYSATAGYGPYYQIRMPPNGFHPLFSLPNGTFVSVALERSNDGDRVVRIARSES